MSTLDQKLTDALVDGKITEHDAAQVRKFAEFLEFIGPHDEGRNKRIHTYMDQSPENRAFVLGESLSDPKEDS